MKDVIKITIAIFVILCIASAVSPFWNRYWLGKELEKVCLYGTKNSVEDTRKYLRQKMKERRYDFRGEDFFIKKDENNRVSISITYTDKISVLGVTLKELEFTVETTASEVEERW